jgi:hypothetical protein
MTLVISKGITLRKGWQPMDADAAAYITAVETADTEPLEEKTKIAIDNFVLGCKADGIWSAIKASCILAGARTLNGALVPLVGTAPTNFNFVSGDYNRKTGLVGNGSTKFLNSNRNNNADPQDSKHLAVYRSTAASTSAGLIGSGNAAGHSHLYTGFGDFITRNNSSGFHTVSLITHPGAIFYGTSRSSSSEFGVRIGGTDYTTTVTSQSPANVNFTVFGPIGVSNARLAFYSIGESLDLALLDARVTDLINAIGAAIPS